MAETTNCVAHPSPGSGLRRGLYVYDGAMWWKGPLIAVALVFFARQARVSRAHRAGSALLFRVSPAVRILWGFGILTLVVVFVTDREPREQWLNALGIAVILALCLAWPSTIAIDQSGVTSSVWWRRRSQIGWNTIADLQKNSSGDIKVYGSDGTVISFTRFHVDPGRFEAEILKGAKLRHTTRADAPVSMRLPGK